MHNNEKKYRQKKKKINNDIKSDIGRNSVDFLSTLPYLLGGQSSKFFQLFKVHFPPKVNCFFFFKPTDQKTVEYHRAKSLPFCQTICVMFYIHWNPFDLQFNLQFGVYRKYANFLFQLVLYTVKTSLPSCLRQHIETFQFFN